MFASLQDKLYYGTKINIVKNSKDCTIYKMKDDTGEGLMTCYKVFPGIDLIYNDFHMKYCISELIPNVKMMGIDHCREGRIEWEFNNNSYMYLKAGDLQINSRKNHNIGFGFPLNHYHGITIAIFIDEAIENLSSTFKEFSIDLPSLYEKFCSKNFPFIMRSGESIEHIFAELYSVSEEIKINYFKIKVLELLLFLNTVEIPLNGEARQYFPSIQVKKIKDIMNFITENLDKHFTIKELCLKFDITQTCLKCCFKGVYGTSIYSFIRTYRIHTAAIMLTKSDESIASIAGKVGYDNSSKFAAAFKSIMGKTPLEHRKSFVQMDS